MHVDECQKQMQYCKTIILLLKINTFSIKEITLFGEDMEKREFSTLFLGMNIGAVIMENSL